MKRPLFAICTVLLLAACSNVRVTQTRVASGVANPKMIYIRPFDVSEAKIRGHQSDPAERVIRGSLAPEEFAIILKEELEKLAPTAVLKDSEIPRHGWLVEGEFEWIHAGSPWLRISGPLGLGRSHVIIHVHITDLDRLTTNDVESKDAHGDEVHKTVSTEKGTVIYDFTLAGGSNCAGLIGNVYSPGGGYAVPIDYRNAAERFMMALSLDPFRLGARSSPVIR